MEKRTKTRITNKEKISRTSTPVKQISKSLLSGQYGSFLKYLRQENNRFFPRGVKKRIPDIISGHFVMFDISEEMHNKLNENASTNDIERDIMELERRNTNILNKVVPFVKKKFANLPVNAKYKN